MRRASRTTAAGRAALAVGLVAVPACARTPATIAAPTPAAPEPASQTFVEATPTGPCAAPTLEVCAEVCSSRACLEWCGGTSCVELAAELHACAMPAATAFDAANPEPQLAFLPPGPDAPKDVMPELDPASEERLMAWQLAREDALAEHWRVNCQTPCETAFTDASPEDVATVCEQAGVSVYAWASLVREPEPPRAPEVERGPDGQARIVNVQLLAQDSEILGQMWGAGSMSMFGGSYLTVDDEGLDRVEHRGALVRLITRDANLAGADACVPELDEDGESFAFTVEFDADGHLRPPRSEVSSAEAECLAELLAAGIELPAPAVRGVPELRLTVHVREYEALDDWGGLMGADIGEAYGVGGLGLSGTGTGGGGTGEGSIGGIGTIGSGGGGGGGAGYGAAAGSSRDVSDDDTDQP